MIRTGALRRRRLLRHLAAMASLTALSSCGISQPVKARIPLVSVLSLNPERLPPGAQVRPAATTAQAFLDGLRTHGYENGKTIIVEWPTWDGGDERRQLAIAQEAVARPSHVIVAYGTDAQRAALAATTTTPIVMFAGIDPVEAGLVKSLARPEVNMTGVASDTAGIAAKRLELLREAFPRITRVAIVSDDGQPRKVQRRATERVARDMGLSVVTVEAHTAEDLARALDVARQSGADSMVVLGNVPGNSLPFIFAFAAATRCPAMYPNDAFVANGGLMTFVENGPDMARRVADYIVRIIAGERPSEMPIERPASFDLVINLKTAREHGLMIPQAVVNRATRVIE